jgi:hypothetical protein
LGEFSPVGLLFTLVQIFRKLQQIYFLPRKKNALTENVLGYILGDFFTNSSGRTAASAGADGKSTANTKLCQKSQKLQSTTVRRNDHGLFAKKIPRKKFSAEVPLRISVEFSRKIARKCNILSL